MLRFKKSAQIFQDIENDGREINGLYVDGLSSVEKFVKEYKQLNPEGHLKKIRSNMLFLGFFKSPYKLNLLAAAALVGNARICRFLLEKMDPSANRQSAIKMAALSGNLEVLNILLADGRCDPCATEGEALILAIGENTRQHDALAVALMNHKEGKVLNSVQRNRHIQIAASVGNDKMIARLLQYNDVDPTAYPQLTMGWALSKGHKHTVYALYHRIIDQGKNPFEGLEIDQVTAVLDVISDRVYQTTVIHDVSGDFALIKPSEDGEDDRPALPETITSNILTFAFGQDTTFDPRALDVEQQVFDGVVEKLKGLNL